MYMKIGRNNWEINKKLLTAYTDNNILSLSQIMEYEVWPNWETKITIYAWLVRERERGETMSLIYISKKIKKKRDHQNL